MEKNISKKMYLLPLATALILIMFVLSRTIFASDEGFEWNSLEDAKAAGEDYVDNGEIIVYEDDDSITVGGVVDEDVLDSLEEGQTGVVFWSTSDYYGQDKIDPAPDANHHCEITDGKFTVNVDLGIYGITGEGTEIKFYVGYISTEGDFYLSKQSHRVLTVKRALPRIDLDPDSFTIYKNDTTIDCEVDVYNTNKVTHVLYGTQSASGNPMDPTGYEEAEVSTTEPGKFFISMDVTNIYGNEEYHVYGVDDDNKIICENTFNINADKGTMTVANESLDNTGYWMDNGVFVLHYGTMNFPDSKQAKVKINLQNVNDYNNIHFGYVIGELPDSEDEIKDIMTEAERIRFSRSRNQWVTNTNQMNNENIIQIPIQKVDRENIIHIFLYRQAGTGRMILDQKDVKIIRDEFDIEKDNAEKSIVVNYQRVDNNIIKMSEEDTKVSFRIRTAKKDNDLYGARVDFGWNDVKDIKSRYRLKIYDSDNNLLFVTNDRMTNENVSSTVYDEWQEFGNNNYSKEFTIDRNNINFVNDEAKYTVVFDRYVYGQNNVYLFNEVESIDFTVSKAEPKLVWDENVLEENSNVILLPKYKNGGTEIADISARVMEYNDNKDQVVYTVDEEVLDVDDTELPDDVKLITCTVSKSGNNNKIRISTSSLPKKDAEAVTCHFYLIRQKSSSKVQIYELGDYSVKYKGAGNSWGQLRYESDVIHRIDDTDTAFCKVTTKNSVKTGKSCYEIAGFSYGILESDELIWSYEKLSGTELIEWANEEDVNKSSFALTNYYNSVYGIYTISLNKIPFMNDSANAYFYIRRKIDDGSYILLDNANKAKSDKDVKVMSELLLKEAHDPILDNVAFTTEEKFDVNSFSMKKYYNFVVEASDLDTGVESITMYYTSDETEAVDSISYEGYSPNEKKKWEFQVEEDKIRNNKYTLCIVVRNKDGRSYKAENVLAYDPKVTIEPCNANIMKGSTIDRDDDYVTASSEETFRVTAINTDKEDISGENSTVFLQELLVYVNGEEVIRKTYDSEDKVAKDYCDVALNNSLIQRAQDSEYTILVKVTNGNGGSAKKDITVYLDDKRPSVTSIDINGTDSIVENRDKKYTYITNKAVEAIINAEDKNSTGLKNIKYSWSDYDNGGVSKEDATKDIEKHPADAFVKASMKESFRGYLRADAEDMVGNCLENAVETYGIIVELPNKHDTENHIDLALSESGAKDSNGNPLYNKAATATIKVADTYSGIKTVNWSITAPHDSSANSAGTLSINDGNLSDGAWSKGGSDENIVTSVSRSLTLDGNSDDMVLKVEMIDNAGNRSEKSVSFSIDKVKPTVSVSYSNDYADPEFKDYFNNNRTATVVVKERNFDTNSANAMISNSLGNAGTVSQWKETRDAQNPDNSTYTATVTFEKDGRYLLSYSCNDRAGNTSDTVSTGEFIIDKIKPEVTVTFDNSTGKNGYYSNVRTATINVKEVNFEASRLGITGINGQDYNLGGWTRRDDTYSSVITFSKDGVFTFDVSVKDKAGNVGNSVHVPEFTIDLIKPEIDIQNVTDRSANKGDVAPKIVFADKNIDKTSITVELYGANRGKVDIKDWYTLSDDGLTILFKNIEKIKENDDLYTLRVSATDLAGNVTKQEIMFSVNRFGSIYILGNNVKNVLDKYVRKAEGLDITEINVDTIDKKKVTITLSINGVPTTLKEGTDYRIVAEESEGEWKQYKYIFEDSNFVKDGSYILTVASEDAAGNKNNNADADKDAEIKFGIDATAPIVEAINFEEGMYYDQNGMECVVSVMDNMLIDSVAIYVDDVQTTYTEDGEMYTFLIPESNRRQSVKVVAKDKAGNETLVVYEGILVAGNFFIRLFHNKMALISILGASALIIAGALALTIRKIVKK